MPNQPQSAWEKSFDEEVRYSEGRDFQALMDEIKDFCAKQIATERVKWQYGEEQSKKPLIQCSFCNELFPKNEKHLQIFCSKNCRQADRYYRQKQWRLESGKQYKKANKEKYDLISKKSKEKYPERDQARILLRQAILRGEIKRMPCEVCGKARVHGHHYDYTKPLDVKWLCTTHHYELHRKYKMAPKESLTPPPPEEIK